MNQTQNKITFPESRQRRCISRAAAALTLLTACTLTAGCGSRDNTPPPAKGPNAVLTPEQEAAKQRAIQGGADLQARQDAAAKKMNGGQ